MRNVIIQAEEIGEVVDEREGKGKDQDPPGDPDRRNNEGDQKNGGQYHLEGFREGNVDAEKK